MKTSACTLLLALALATPVLAQAPATSPSYGVLLGREAAAKRYREGLGHERRGDDHRALAAFLEAAESGHGPAQKKLGEIYDEGNSAVTRNYQASIQWYEKAREQGVPIAKPHARPGP